MHLLTVQPLGLWVLPAAEVLLIESALFIYISRSKGKPRGWLGSPEWEPRIFVQAKTRAHNPNLSHALHLGMGMRGGSFSKVIPMESSRGIIYIHICKS